MARTAGQDKVRELQRTLYGNSAHHLDAINDYAARRLALFVAKRHKRRRSYG